jgi:hypothetical protein
MVSLDFSVTYSFRPHHGPGVDSPLVKMSTRNIPGRKGGRCVRLITSPPSCVECHEIWEPKPPGTLWVTPGLLRDCFTFLFVVMCRSIRRFLHKGLKLAPLWCSWCLCFTFGNNYFKFCFGVRVLWQVLRVFLVPCRWTPVQVGNDGFLPPYFQFIIY